jgi:hypothetical protein
VIRAPKTHHSELGTFGSGFHRFAEDYAGYCFSERKPMALDRAAELASRHRATDDDLYDVCLSWAERTEFNWDLVVADGQSIERWLERELPNGDLFRGRLDMVLYDAAERHIICHDYKTSWRPPEWEPDEPPFQHLCYAWLAFGEWPSESCIARCEYVRQAGEPLHEWELVPPLDWIGESLVERIAAIDAETERLGTRDPDITPGAHCAWCDYLVGCPLEHEASAVLSDSSRLGEAWGLAEGLATKAAALRKPPKAHVDEHGPTYLLDGRLLKYTHAKHADPDGFELQVRPGQVLAFLDRVMRMCGGAEAVAKATSISGSNIAKLLDKHPEAGLDEFLVKVRARATLKAVEPEVPKSLEVE